MQGIWYAVPMFTNAHMVVVPVKVVVNCTIAVKVNVQHEQHLFISLTPIAMVVANVNLHVAILEGTNVAISINHTAIGTTVPMDEQVMGVMRVVLMVIAETITD